MHYPTAALQKIWNCHILQFAAFNIYLSDGAIFDATYVKDQDLIDGAITYYGYNAGDNGHCTVSVKNTSNEVITDQSVGSGGTVYVYSATPESSSYNTLVWTKGPGGEIIGDGNTVRVTCAENAQFQVYANYTHTHTYGTPVWSWNDHHATATFSCTDIHCPVAENREVAVAGSESSVVIDPTCTDDRKSIYSATVEFQDHTYTTTHDDLLIVTDSNSALGHDWDEWEVTPPTCTEDGEKTRTCRRDPNHRQTRYFEALGHSLTKTDAKEATCTATGNTDYWTCRNCGKIFRDAAAENEITIEETVIPVRGHTLTKTEAKASTCETAGNTEYWTCTSCEKIFRDESATNEITIEDTLLPLLDHNLAKTDAKAATCETAGNIEFWTCQSCGRIFSEEDAMVEIAQNATEIPALGHDWGDWEVVTPANCTETGIKKRICRRNGEHIETQIAEALGHDWDEWEVTEEATETADGSRTRQCKNDPTHIQTETIPATGGGYRFVPDGTADEEVASADDPTYQWKKNSGQNLLFVVKNAFDDSETADKLLAVLVDGQEIDSSHYTAAEGSLRLTLKAAYLQTLSVGTHTLTVRFTDGTVSHTFTVLPAPAGSDSPVTGESAIALAVSAILLALAAAGAAYAVLRRRKALA